MRIRCDRAKMHQTMDCFGKYSSYQQRFMFQGDAIIQWKEKTESKRNERCICALSYVASNCVRVFEPRLATLRHKNSPPCSRFCAFNSLWFCFCIFFSLHSILKWIREDLCVCDILCIIKSARDNEERRWMLKRDYKWLLGELEIEFKVKLKKMHSHICVSSDFNDLYIFFLSFLVSATVKPRHKSHLVYQFTESQEMNNVVSQATLNIFVYSKNYLRSTDVQLQKNARLIDIEIAKVLQGSQHKMIFETFRNISIPDGGNDGEYVQLNITDMVAEWFSSHETSHGLSVKIIASRTGAALPHKTVSLDAENFSTVSREKQAKTRSLKYVVLT